MGYAKVLLNIAEKTLGGGEVKKELLERKGQKQQEEYVTQGYTIRLFNPNEVRKMFVESQSTVVTEEKQSEFSGGLGGVDSLDL